MKSGWDGRRGIFSLFLEETKAQTAEVALLAAGPAVPAASAWLIADVSAALLRSCLLHTFREVIALCLSEWSLLVSTGCWVLVNLALLPPWLTSSVSSSGVSALFFDFAPVIFKVPCPAVVPCAWSGRVCGHPDPWDVMTGAGVSPLRVGAFRCRHRGVGADWVERQRDRDHLTVGRAPPNPRLVLLPSRPVFPGPSFLHVLFCRS